MGVVRNARNGDATGPFFPVPAPPGPGQTIEIATGVYWLSTFLPFRLRAVNLWLLRDHDGWTMVDCGFTLPEVRRQIEAAWGSVLGGMPIRRLVVTHHHPDHVGNCRWICERWGIVPTMTLRERDQSEVLLGKRWDDSSRERIEFWRRHGLTEDEAVAIGNDTIYGLAGAVWTNDAGRGQRVAARLRHGTIWINDYHPYLPQAEWGGFKQSGIGRELGPGGLDEYREAKHIYQNTAPGPSGWFGG